jgi:hypothetical protein
MAPEKGVVMKLRYAREQLHRMRSSLNVVINFVSAVFPSSDDEKLHKEVTQTSISKLSHAIEELDKLLVSEQNRK